MGEQVGKNYQHFLRNEFDEENSFKWGVNEGRYNVIKDSFLNLDASDGQDLTVNFSKS